MDGRTPRARNRREPLFADAREFVDQRQRPSMEGRWIFCELLEPSQDLGNAVRTASIASIAVRNPRILLRNPRSLEVFTDPIRSIAKERLRRVERRAWWRVG
jgi:hypothetical protein